jgi:DMSO/TMAO reductase YedYZ molybdopterin-dependent catalytic subunit
MSQPLTSSLPSQPSTAGSPPIGGAPSPRVLDLAAFVAGALAAAVGIAVGEIAAGLVAGAPSLVIAIGDLIIELQPEGAKDLMVELFGEADKLVLNLMIVGAALLIAGILGVIGRRDVRMPVAGFVVAGLLGLGAALRQPLTEGSLAVATVALAIGAALLALRVLLATIPPATPATPDPSAEAVRAMPDWDRRRFLQASGGVALGSLALGVVGRNLLDARPGGAPPDVALPVAAGPAPSVPPGASLDVPGITPIVIPNDRFYRIDTALVSPRVDADTWQLSVTGMVDREVTLTHAELSAMPLFEQYVTIACVSNEVGGNLVGNALWTGVDLREVLDMAGVQSGASQIVGRSVDGWTAGFPTAWAMDPDRRPMIALGMNHAPLPVDHGYPARLIIPGLYGYVSATKWLSEIELTTLEAFDAYWVPRGWAKEAPILTQSRIDVPRQGASLAAGRVAVAGVAWAPDRGIAAVEVRVDEGAWQPAVTSEPLTEAAWVQWTLTWEATPGEHLITVRATDGEGVVQTDERTRPAPDGARGHHSVSVRVT